jgi:HSP20 family molecular chaperone IbpA
LAERKETVTANKEKAKGQTHLNEHRYMRIERYLTLSVSVDESKVDAKL